MTETAHEMRAAETLRAAPQLPRYQRAYSYRTRSQAVQCVRSLYALGTKACWQQCGQWYDVYEENPLYVGT